MLKRTNGKCVGVHKLRSDILIVQIAHGSKRTSRYENQGWDEIGGTPEQEAELNILALALKRWEPPRKEQGDVEYEPKNDSRQNQPKHELRNEIWQSRDLRCPHKGPHAIEGAT